MAKSETRLLTGTAGTEPGSDDFDLDALLHEDLSTIPDEQKITGAWIVKWISSFVNHGRSEKGPWVMITINFEPQYPFGDDATTTAEQLDMDDLPRLRHRVFYSSFTDKRDFRALAAKFGAVPGELIDMMKEARGGECIATVTNKKDRRGQPETKLTNFREVPDMTPPI